MRRRPRPCRSRLAVLSVVRHDVEQLQRNRSVIGTPLRIGTKNYAHGLGTHAVSQVRIQSLQPIARFTAAVGVDNNDRTKGKAGSVVFRVSSAGRELLRTRTLRGGDEPQAIDLKVNGVLTLDLHVDDAGDGVDSDHADWATPASCCKTARRCGSAPCRGESSRLPLPVLVHLWRPPEQRPDAGLVESRPLGNARCRPHADDDHLDRSADRLADRVAGDPLRRFPGRRLGLVAEQHRFGRHAGDRGPPGVEPGAGRSAARRTWFRPPPHQRRLE